MACVIIVAWAAALLLPALFILFGENIDIAQLNYNIIYFILVRGTSVKINNTIVLFNIQSVSQEHTFCSSIVNGALNFKL